MERQTLLKCFFVSAFVSVEATVAFCIHQVYVVSLTYRPDNQVSFVVTCCCLHHHSRLYKPTQWRPTTDTTRGFTSRFTNTKESRLTGNCAPCQPSPLCLNFTIVF